MTKLQNIGIFFLLFIIFIYLLILTLYFSTRVFIPKWPLKFRLKNHQGKNSIVFFYINDQMFNSYSFSDNALIVIGENVINPNTGKPLKEEEIYSLSFRLSDPVDISVKSNVDFQMVYTDASGNIKGKVSTLSFPGKYNIYYS